VNAVSKIHPLRLVLPLLLLVGLRPLAHAASVLDIGTDYRIRGISLSSPEFGAPGDQNYAYYSQRALAHVGGRFSPNIEFMTQFQALGVAGSTSSVNNLIANQAGNRYPNTNFTPWVQWAYFKATQVYDSPVNITVGRQPITLGDGLILSDDDLGFTGIRMQSDLPWYGLQGDAFTFKNYDSLVGHSDTDIYGIQITKPLHAVRFQFSWVTEHDASGSTVYIRPSENAATILAANPNSTFVASRIVRSFYDARVEGHLLQGGFYKGEFALQSGHVSRDPTLPDPSVNLSGYAGLVSAGLYTKISKYGPIEIHGLFGIASGDSGNSNTDSSFHPDFGHRFDGLERSGFGELFGATLYDAIASSANPNGLPPGNSGLRVIGAGVTTHPTALLSFGIDYFVYTSEENNLTAFPTTSVDSSLGTELDLGAGFAYTNYLNFRGTIAFFNPGAAYTNGSKAQRYMIEAIGHF
jgi:hypothetical protein